MSTTETASIRAGIKTLPRNEYPRPQFVRKEWVNLNGEWEFEFDDENIGLVQKWYEGREFSRKIQVPFAWQSQLSQIGDTKPHDVAWYRRKLELPSSFDGKRVFLHFGAVDYEATVWVNGYQVIVHQGGNTPFSVDITKNLHERANVLVVRAFDSTRDLDQPRGKQYWKEKSEGIFYTRTSGIWQTVWLEAVGHSFLKGVKFTPDIDKSEVGIEFDICMDGASQLTLDLDIRYQDKIIAKDSVSIYDMVVSRKINLQDFDVHSGGRLWSPEHPNLYDVIITLYKDGEQLDVVSSYFGMRKISVENGKVLLNNRPYYMKLVLDQGYFPDGILTAPNDSAIRKDIELTKEMGFNGARKHQKVEDPRYLYWCDRLGLLVWGEMANSHSFSVDGVERITKEWIEVIRRDYNHPCIVAWVPVNESWGVPRLQADPRQTAHITSLYYLTKSIDSTRLVISNDGWEHTVSDLCTIHDYDSSKESLKKRYATAESAISAAPGHRFIHASNFCYRGEPILITEFGGIAFKKSEWEGWGYSGAESEKDFLQRYAAVVEGILESSVIQGFCYTQLTDVEQEINGLLTYDREAKVDLELIRKINQRQV